MADKSNGHEAEKIQELSQEPLEVLEHLLEKSERTAVDVVRNELIERKKLPGPGSPELSGFAKSWLHNLQRRKALYRNAIERKRALEGALGKTAPTELADADNTSAASRTAATEHARRNRQPSQREVIDAFREKVAEAGWKITRTNIWTVAGYTDATEFERFQRGSARTTRSAAQAFYRVLRMEPKRFIESLCKKLPAR